MANWNDERIEFLKKLWTDGFSAPEIAEQLGGVTRSGVSGKARQLGLPKRQATFWQIAVRRPKKLVAVSEAADAELRALEASLGEAHPDAVHPEGIPFLETDDDQCGFLLENGNCCAMPKADRSYCNFHYAKTHVIGSVTQPHVVSVARIERDGALDERRRLRGGVVRVITKPAAPISRPAVAANSAFIGQRVSGPATAAQLVAAVKSYYGDAGGSFALSALYSLAARSEETKGELARLLGGALFAEVKRIASVADDVRGRDQVLSTIEGMARELAGRSEAEVRAFVAGLVGRCQVRRRVVASAQPAL